MEQNDPQSVTGHSPGPEKNLTDPAGKPAPWYQPAPWQFDLAWPRYLKLTAVLLLLAVAFVFDTPIARWLYQHPVVFKSDVNLELIWAMQFGQWTCSVIVILAVALIDPQGRRRAIALATGCLSAVACCYLFKGLFGRTRPWVLHNGLYHFLGPAYGFGHGASYQSFPSAHTSGAFALAAGLSWFYPRGRGLFYFMGLVVAWQRVMRHAHFPSDVVAGGLLAVSVVRTVLWLGWPGKLIAVLPRKWQAWIFTENKAVATTKV